MAELIVQARWVVTGIKDRSTPIVIEDGAVLSRDGVIVATGALEEMQKLAPTAETRSTPTTPCCRASSTVITMSA